MLWRSLAQIGYRGISSYDDVIGGRPPDKSGGGPSDESLPDPDPVEVVGCVNTRSLKRRLEKLGFNALLPGLRLLVDPEECSKYECTTIDAERVTTHSKKRRRWNPRRLVFTNKKYRRHFELLKGKEGRGGTQLMEECPAAIYGFSLLTSLSTRSLRVRELHAQFLMVDDFLVCSFLLQQLTFRTSRP